MREPSVSARPLEMLFAADEETVQIVQVMERERIAAAAVAS